MVRGVTQTEAFRIAEKCRYGSKGGNIGALQTKKERQDFKSRFGAALGAAKPTNVSAWLIDGKICEPDGLVAQNEPAHSDPLGSASESTSASDTSLPRRCDWLDRRFLFLFDSLGALIIRALLLILFPLTLGVGVPVLSDCEILLVRV